MEVCVAGTCIVYADVLQPTSSMLGQQFAAFCLMLYRKDTELIVLYCTLGALNIANLRPDLLGQLQNQ